MTMRRLTQRGNIPVVVFGFLLAMSLRAHGADLKVECGGKRQLPTISSALKKINPAGPNTVTVVGTCTENVLIRGFNRLTLIGGPGASINDASGGTGFVVDIEDSTHVTLQGFTINGGLIGVFCADFSICRFKGNTIQGALQSGVQVVQSRASFDTNTVQNNLLGLTSLESSSVRSNGGLVVQQNQDSGVVIDTGSSFAAFGTTVQNNGNAGIEMDVSASLSIADSTITGNLFGVTVLSHSDAHFFANNVITGNQLNGVVVRDLSFVLFEASSTITGNGAGVDVVCQPKFSATRGAPANIGGGITDCTE
jgi:Periplasmic copper-binding protein (NosD)